MMSARPTFLLPVALALFAGAFALSPAYGQFRPPRPNFPPAGFNGGRPGFNGGQPGMNPAGFNGGQPGMNPRFPGGGNTLVNVWKCSGCGAELGRGLSAPPATCPSCGARIINGVGNGIPQPGAGGMMGNPNPTNPNPAGPFNPQPGFNPNPPIMNPPQQPGFNGGQPVTNPPPAFNPPGVNEPPVVQVGDSNPGSSSGGDASTSASSSGSGRWKVVALVIGIITVGVFVLIGGTFLMIYTMRSSNPAPARRRRRRRDDDYDD